MGPALQDEGGSLRVYVSQMFKGSGATTAALSPCSSTPHSQTVMRANGRVRRRRAEERVHVPTEVSEFLVDTLEGHGDLWVVLLWVGWCSGAVLRRERGWVVEEK